MFFDVTKLENIDKYRLLTGGVTPRPIAWISTRSKSNVDNLAPYSFFTVASCNPPVLLYTQVPPRNGTNKDTLQNLLETRECVVNIVSSDLMCQMNQTSAALQSEQSEFAFADVESCDSQSVSVKSVKLAPVRYECRLKEVITISDEPTGGSIILLDVTHIYVQDDMIENGMINQDKLDTVGKMGADFFTLTKQLVELKRP